MSRKGVDRKIFEAKMLAAYRARPSGGRDSELVRRFVPPVWARRSYEIAVNF